MPANSPLDLSSKTVLITGGCGAIGQVIVRVLSEHGATVAVNDILPEAEGTQVLNRASIVSPRVRYYPADASDPQSVNGMFDQVEQTLGVPNVVCCHAGVVHVYPIDQYPMEKFDQLFKVNVRSAFVVAQEAAQRWIEKQIPGHLIFTISWVADVPWPEITPYNASKSAMRMLMRGFARELAPKGIRANAVAPGVVGVGMGKRQWEIDSAYRARVEKAIPLGALQPPDSVAYAFLYLCSDMANYMTGSVLLIDGGCSLYPMD
jgi:NAD(P)-dependent dehydrogenase (short-subunit alcohol dehydrogenase family)